LVDSSVAERADASSSKVRFRVCMLLLLSSVEDLNYRMTGGTIG